MRHMGEDEGGRMEGAAQAGVVGRVRVRVRVRCFVVTVAHKWPWVLCVWQRCRRRR